MAVKLPEPYATESRTLVVSSGNTVTAGQVISVAMATCATAQTGRNVVTIIFTPTA